MVAQISGFWGFYFSEVMVHQVRGAPALPLISQSDVRVLGCDYSKVMVRRVCGRSSCPLLSLLHCACAPKLH